VARFAIIQICLNAEKSDRHFICLWNHTSCLSLSTVKVYVIDYCLVYYILLRNYGFFACCCVIFTLTVLYCYPFLNKNCCVFNFKRKMSVCIGFMCGCSNTGQLYSQPTSPASQPTKYLSLCLHSSFIVSSSRYVYELGKYLSGYYNLLHYYYYYYRMLVRYLLMQLRITYDTIQEIKACSKPDGSHLSLFHGIRK